MVLSRFLAMTPEEKWQAFLEVTSRELTQADAARKWLVDVSTIITVRKLVKDAAMAAFASTKPGRPSVNRHVIPWPNRHVIPWFGLRLVV